MRAEQLRHSFSDVSVSATLKPGADTNRWGQTPINRKAVLDLLLLTYPYTHRPLPLSATALSLSSLSLLSFSSSPSSTSPTFQNPPRGISFHLLECPPTIRCGRCVAPLLTRPQTLASLRHFFVAAIPTTQLRFFTPVNVNHEHSYESAAFPCPQLSYASPLLPLSHRYATRPNTSPLFLLPC